MSRRAPAFAAAAVGAGLLGAGAVPGERAGLGVALCALGLAVAVGVAIRWRPRSRLLAVLAIALASMAVVRDAPWVVAMCLVAALLLAVAAMTGAETWRAVARIPLALRPVSGAGVVAVCGASALPGRAEPAVTPVATGLAASLPLVALFGALFAWADPAFAELAGDTLPTEWGDLDARLALLLGMPTLAGALVAARMLPAPVGEEPRRRAGTIEWAASVAVLDALFAGFVAVQVAVLFGGDEHVLRTVGLSYAEYAREGFAQLVGVAVLALALVAVAVRTARAGTDRSALVLRGLLGVLIVLTLVVLASAMHRLGLYESAFGFTRLRLGVHAFMLWLAGVLALVLAALALASGRLLPRAVAAGTGAFVLAFALTNPDATIAERNLERAAETGRVDVAYLAGLSADAVPALAAAPERPALARQARRLAESDGWAGWNLARERAREALDR